MMLPAEYQGRSLRNADIDHLDIRNSNNSPDLIEENDRYVNDIKKSSKVRRRSHQSNTNRKRRNHLKEVYGSLRDAVPFLRGGRIANKTLILRKAAEYIQYMRKKNTVCLEDIDYLEKENTLLDSQIRGLERDRNHVNFVGDVLASDTESDLYHPDKASGNSATETSDFSFSDSEPEVGKPNGLERDKSH